MKLSMWILADWLKEYDMRPRIQDGHTNISGIRFLSGRNKDFAQDQVYIGKAEDLFDDPLYRSSIVLAHERDLILIDNADAEDIINEVLTAIDYYNNWEAQLWEAISSDNSFQQMLNLSDELFDNPSRIVDMQGNVLGISQMFGPNDVNQRWKNMYKTGLVNLSNVSLQVITVEGETLDDWPETPAIYYVTEDGKRQNYIAGGIWLDEEIVAAFLILEYKTPLSIAHCQLAAVFCRILKTALMSHSNTYLLQPKTFLLEELLAGARFSEDQHAGLRRLGIDSPMNLAVLHCVQQKVPAIRNGSMLSLIRKSPVVNLSVIFEDQIVTITAEASLQTHLEHILTVINTRHYAIGISLPFYEWDTFPAPYKEACLSCEINSSIPGIFYCRDYAFELLLSAVDQANEGYHILHPALGLLRQYDKLHATCFYETLYQYLVNERNIAQTCKAMYIHRNTLLYRIKRIMQLIECDLNDLDERLFLLLSYRIAAQDAK